jgi:hypothetical protein
MSNFLESPMNKKAIEENMSESGYITGNVLVPLDDLIYCEDLDSFFDNLSEKLIGTVLLTDISYKVVDIFDDETIIMEVSGNVSDFIDDLCD